jgi:hypothetical protein
VVEDGFVKVKLELGEICFRERMLGPSYYRSVPKPFICHPGDRLQVQRRVSAVPKLQENILLLPTGVQNIYLFISL